MSKVVLSITVMKWHEKKPVHYSASVVTAKYHILVGLNNRRFLA
jgi:hypothetical protein